MSHQEMSTLESHERLSAYQLISQGNAHVWSKGAFQREKAVKFLEDLIPLTSRDPIFLAHLTSYIFRHSQSKDLKVFLAFVNSLSSADGSKFTEESEIRKPNLRYLAYAALHDRSMNPKMVLRTLELANTKISIPGYLSNSRHLTTGMKNAFRKYLLFREANPYILESQVKAGFKERIKNIYRILHMNPSDAAAATLRWRQKDREITITRQFSFDGLTHLQIAEMIQSEKIPYLTAMGELGRVEQKVTKPIAVALLEQASGDQAVIMTSTFDSAGVLSDPEVKALYEEKIASAKTTLDRAKTISKNVSKEVGELLKKAKSDKRKEATIGMGKIFVHLDLSDSMDSGIEVARKLGAIIGEMINNPKENFDWAGFNSSAVSFPMPTDFSEAGFAQALFGARCWGATNALANYVRAREFGADVDIFISDGEHNMGNISQLIEHFHEQNPNIAKPKAMLHVDVPNTWNQVHPIIVDGYNNAGIPSTHIRPEALTESALVSEAFRTAIMGPIAVIDQIMETPLLELPEYYYTI